MAHAPEVLLSGFADEAANQKTAVQQCAAMAALGLKYMSLRFIDVGQGIKNVMQLSPEEVTAAKSMLADYGLSIATIGSPLGKVKLIDQDDGSTNRYVPFEKYLAEDVHRACDLAHAFGSKLIRGFSFYHPKGTDPAPHVPQVAEQLHRIGEVCAKAGLIYGIEIEANLVGQTGQLMAEIHAAANHPSLVTIFDAANILCQGYTSAELFEQYLVMKPSLGWMHIKDYLPPPHVGPKGHVDEEALKHFVPADQGGSGHEAILRDFKTFLPELSSRMTALGAPGVFLDLEPHVKGGGQFGGFSGPDGFGVALRSLCRVLHYLGIRFHLRDFEDIRAARGF